MKKTILLLALLGVLLTSCFKDEEVTYNDYCYISDVSLGTLKRWQWTTDSVGNPVKYQTTYTASTVQMTIDQRDTLIENRDSLLYGTDLSAALINISFSGATLVYRPAADTTAKWTAYNSKDSIDLRQPLHLMVVANDGASYRLYTLRLNVHQQEGDSLYWHRVDSSVTTLDGMTIDRAVALRGKLHVMGTRDGQVCVASRSLAGESGQWTAQNTNLPIDAQVGTLCQWDSTLYMSTSDGDLYYSQDARMWNRLASMGQDVRLLGAGKSFLYALSRRTLMRSADGEVWDAEAIDDDAAWLPDTCVYLLPLDGADGDSRVVMVGYRSAQQDTTAVVWNKTWTRSGREEQAEWIHFNQTSDNKWLCPHLTSLNVMAYDGRCLAYGGASDRPAGKYEAMSNMYFSPDYGITWKPDYQLHLPRALRGVEGPVASAVDQNNNIWIIANGEVWRGRLNRLGFLRQ